MCHVRALKESGSLLWWVDCGEMMLLYAISHAGSGAESFLLLESLGLGRVSIALLLRATTIIHFLVALLLFAIVTYRSLCNLGVCEQTT